MTMIFPFLSLLLLAKGVGIVGPVPAGSDGIAGCGIQFVDGQNGWLLCEIPPTVHVTNDGGETWKAVALPAAPEYLGKTTVVHSPIRGQFISRSRAWLLVDNHFFGSENGARSWTELSSLPIDPTIQQISDLTVSPDERLIVAIERVDRESPQRSDAVLTSIDSGRTWRKRAIEKGQYQIAAIGSTGLVYLIGSKVLVSADRGMSWSQAGFTFTGGKSDPFVSSSPRPMSICFLQSLAWLVYENGYLFRSEDRGRSWYELARRTQVWPDNLWPGSFTIRFLTTDHGYVVGGDGLLRESYDGGFTWRVIPLDGEKVADVSCFDIRTCYALTDKGRMLRVESVGGGVR